MKLTITIRDENVIIALKSKKNKMGEYVTELVKENIKYDELRSRIERLEGKK